MLSGKLIPILTVQYFNVLRSDRPTVVPYGLVNDCQNS